MPGNIRNRKEKRRTFSSIININYYFIQFDTQTGTCTQKIKLHKVLFIFNCNVTEIAKRQNRFLDRIFARQKYSMDKIVHASFNFINDNKIDETVFFNKIVGFFKKNPVVKH